MMTRIENRLSVVSKFLSYHGRLTLVNSVFSALPTFYMCSLKIPPQVIKKIYIFKKHCLWSKGDINRRGSCLVAWEIACKPKTQGGLGIIDTKSQNEALLMKFLDIFFNSAMPWVTFTWTKFYSNTQTPPQAKSPVGSFGGRKYLKSLTNIRSLLSVHLTRVI